MIKQTCIILCLLSLSNVYAQDDLMKELESQPQAKTFTFATFKGTRLINLHTIETLRKGALDFRISHRFGNVSSGSQYLWGLDGPATLRLGLDYSLTDRLTVGISRTSYKKMFEGFAKYKILRQAAGSMPVSVTAFVSTNVTSEPALPNPATGIDRYEYFSSRMNYVWQLMVARKITSGFSLQISPIVVHQNLVTESTERNDALAVAGMFRYKVTPSIAVTGEYIFRATKYSLDFDRYQNVTGLGLDVETGGHVFQLFFTNGSALNESILIPYTDSRIEKKEFRFGFNISRVFEFQKEL
jgi:hypothetical protein